MSETKKEYDVFKGLLNGSQVHTLDSQDIVSEIRAQAQTRLGSLSRIYVLHDGSDIRKPESSDMEYLGKVMSLQKQVVNGYKTMNSVGVDMDSKELTLLEHTTYSTGLPEYVSQENINLVLKNPGYDPNIAQQIANTTYLNNKTVYFQTVLNSHDTIKRSKTEAQITHIQDREFDGEDYFEYVDDLGDEFITRLKLSRLSNQSRPIYTKTGKLSKKIAYDKLIDKVFENSYSYDIARMSLKHKTYVNIQCAIEWESLIINERTYSVIKIALKDETGKAIFQHPMMLVTNRLVNSAQEAKQVYQAYLLRFKIEVVFRFLKTNLGWETFQVRNFESIKNLLAFAFFLVGYFKELSNEIQNHEIYALIAQIGGSKGTVSTFFLLKGIEKLVHFQQIQKLLDDNIISRDDIQNALKNFETG